MSKLFKIQQEKPLYVLAEDEQGALDVADAHGALSVSIEDYFKTVTHYIGIHEYQYKYCPETHTLRGPDGIMTAMGSVALALNVFDAWCAGEDTMIKFQNEPVRLGDLRTIVADCEQWRKDYENSKP